MIPPIFSSWAMEMDLRNNSVYKETAKMREMRPIEVKIMAIIKSVLTSD